MSLSHSPSIVTNGLVLHLDAASPKSYPRTGTTWFDRSGNNNNGTLVNGVVYNANNYGAFSFNGSNQYVQTSFTTQLNNFTICSWFKSSATGYARIADKKYDTGFWFGSNNSPTLWGGGVKQASNYNNITLSNNQWHFLAMVRVGTSLTVYGDGVTNTNTTTCGAGSIDSTALSLGGTVNDGGGQRDWLNGNISQVSIYNRALSASEILQNFNAIKGRFNL